MPEVSEPISLGGWAEDPCGLITMPYTLNEDALTGRADRTSPTACAWTWDGQPVRVEVEVYPDKDILREEYKPATTDLSVWVPVTTYYQYPALTEFTDERTCQMTIGLSASQGVQIRQITNAKVTRDELCSEIRQTQFEVMHSLVKTPK